MTPFLLTQDSPVLAFSVDDTKTRGKIPEEAFVLYTFRSRSGRLLQRPDAMLEVCQNIESVLNQEKIRTSDEAQCSTIKLEGLRYISLKYMSENIKRNQKQSNSNASTIDPYRDDNPYRRFIRGNNRLVTFFKPINNDDVSVVSDLTCEL